MALAKPSLWEISGRFNPVPSRNLRRVARRALRWLWDQYLPEGALVLLAAFMKVGKSTLAFELAVAVAAGFPFLGRATRRGGVLILAVEENPRDVGRRLERLQTRGRDRIYVHAEPLAATPENLRAIRQFVLEKKIRVVILDTLSTFWNLEDENNNAAVVRAIKPLLQLARETNAVVFLLHHERKAGGEGGRSIRGGGALFGLVDQALLLERPPGGRTNQRVLRSFGRYDETPPELVIEYVDGRYRSVGTPEEVGREAVAARVYGLLGREARSLKSIAEKAGLSPRAVEGALQDLGTRVSREGKGVRGDPYVFRRAPRAPASDESDE